MLADYTDSQRNIDIDFKIRLEQLAKEIDIMNEEARNKVYQEEYTNVKEWHEAYLAPFLDLCLDIQQVIDSNPSKPTKTIFRGKWEDKYK